MSIIDWFEQQMRSDLEDRDDQSRRLIELYETQDDPTKIILDEAFICLSGYSLMSAIEENKEKPPKHLSLRQLRAAFAAAIRDSKAADQAMTEVEHD